MNTPEKIAQKRQLLIARTAEALKIPEPEAERLLLTRRHSSFRINRLKVDDDLSLLAELATLGWKGRQSPIYEDGYGIAEGRTELVDSAAVKDGLIFIQNQASWLPVLALDPQPGERILDICAAPGGKATHIAVLTDNQAQLVVNDNSRPRLFKLRANFERLGAAYTEQTMVGIERLSKTFDHESFDKIILDAPCSGEGLININNPKDFTYWSAAQIKRLQQLQKKAIMSAWQLLKPGGTLIYSTCTIAPEENELVIDYLLSKSLDATLEPLGFNLLNAALPVREWHERPLKHDLTGALRLMPSDYIEAFFVAKIVKTAS